MTTNNLTTNSNNNLVLAPKETSKKNLLKNKSINTSSSLKKNSKNNLIKRKVSKLGDATKQNKPKNTNLNIEEINDDEENVCNILYYIGAILMKIIA